MLYNFWEVVRNIKNVIIRNVFRRYEYAQDEPVKTYILNSNNAFKAATNGSLAVTKELLICSDMKRNVISKVFLFGTSYNYDLISTLSKELWCWIRYK